MPHIAVDLRDTTIHCLDRGSGSPVLFVHGFPLDHTLWLDQVAALSARGRRCVAPDLRGSGLSSATREPVLTMERHAADLTEVVERLELGRVDVIALSMGGYVALALWEADPSLVGSLTLVDTRATADGPEARANRDGMIERLVADGRSALAAEMVRGLLGHSPSADAVARLRSMIEGTRYETMVGAIRGMRDRADRSGVLRSISVPTLVVSGAEDRLIPEEESRAMAEAIPDARHVSIPGAGHLPPIEQPEAFTETLREFLQV